MSEDAESEHWWLLPVCRILCSLCLLPGFGKLGFCFLQSKECLLFLKAWSPGIVTGDVGPAKITNKCCWENGVLTTFHSQVPILVDLGSLDLLHICVCVSVCVLIVARYYNYYPYILMIFPVLRLLFFFLGSKFVLQVYSVLEVPYHNLLREIISFSLQILVCSTESY